MAFSDEKHCNVVHDLLDDSVELGAYCQLYVDPTEPLPEYD